MTARRVVDRIRPYGRDEVATLLRWAKRTCREQPLDVLLVGLAFLLELNEHQIAAANVAAHRPLRIIYPDARRKAEIPSAPLLEATLDAPAWLAAAAEAVVESGLCGSPGRPLLRKRGRIMEERISAGFLRERVEQATSAGIGFRLTIHKLNITNVPVAVDRGHALAGFAAGRSPNWAARMAVAEREPRFPC